MSFKAVIFDFNGTLFWDTAYHNQAWDQFLEQHQIALSDEEKLAHFHGKPNQDIFRTLLRSDLTDDEVQQLTMEKETLYQKIALEHTMSLADGVVDFFEFLQENQIPFTIATASGKENLDFYFEYLRLSNWFEYERVVYNDGTFPGKPNPDIFLLAAQKLGIPTNQTIILEDAPAGIKAAESADAGKIYIVNSVNGNYDSFSHDVIHHFSEIDRSLLTR